MGSELTGGSKKAVEFAVKHNKPCLHLHSRQADAAQALQDFVDRGSAGRPGKQLISTGRLVKDGLRKALKDRQSALTDLIHAIREYRRSADKPLTIRRSDSVHAVQELNKAIDRAEGLLQ